MNLRLWSVLIFTLACTAQPGMAQITILDSAQDSAGAASAPAEAPPGAAPPPVCGTRPLSIARMSWPSAALLAEIHALVLAKAYDCTVRVTAGDLAATASSMGSTGQPSMAPEMWVTRIADVWNGAIESQMVRSAAPTYAEANFEGWFVPAYLANSFTTLPAAGELAVALPQLQAGAPLRFISCPIDWACSVINRNLIKAHGLEDLVEIVEPANRFEMDTLIAEAFGRREPFITYYWQPNAVLAQLDFVGLDMGPYIEEAAKCLADRFCADPQPSAFATDLVVMAVADRLFSDAPAIVGYFQRSTMPFAEMNRLLAQLNEPGATPEGVAAKFVAERADVWEDWVGL